MRWSHEHTNHRHRQPERRRWQNNNLCELGNRSGTGRKESASDRRGPTRKPDNQLGKSATGQAAIYTVGCNGQNSDGSAYTPRRRYSASCRRRWPDACGYSAFRYGGFFGKRHEPWNDFTAIPGHTEGTIFPYPDWLSALVGDAYGQCAGGCEQDHNSRSGRVSARQRTGTAFIYGQQGKTADQSKAPDWRYTADDGG